MLSDGDCSNESGEILVGTGVYTGEQLEIVSVGSLDYCEAGGSQHPGFVNDNPFQEYVGKSDAIVTQAMYGDAGYNTNSFTASDAKDGQSTVTLDIGGGAATTHMFKLVRSADDPDNNDLTAVGANVVVSIAQASNLYN